MTGHTTLAECLTGQHKQNRWAYRGTLHLEMPSAAQAAPGVCSLASPDWIGVHRVLRVTNPQLPGAAASVGQAPVGLATQARQVQVQDWLKVRSGDLAVQPEEQVPFEGDKTSP